MAECVRVKPQKKKRNKCHAVEVPDSKEDVECAKDLPRIDKLTLTDTKVKQNDAPVCKEMQKNISNNVIQPVLANNNECNTGNEYVNAEKPPDNHAGIKHDDSLSSTNLCNGIQEKTNVHDSSMVNEVKNMTRSFENPYITAIDQIRDIPEMQEVQQSTEASAPPLSIADSKALTVTFYPEEESCTLPQTNENSAVIPERILEISPIERGELLIPSTDNVKPFTDVDLKGIYCNLQLENKEAEIRKFINKEADTPKHYLYELLQNYYRSRLNQISSYEEAQNLNKEMLNELEDVWQFSSHSVVEEGTCEDDELVEAKHDYKLAHFRDDIATSVSKNMKSLREIVFETHSLHCYTAEMNRIAVENYLLNVMKKFDNLPKNHPVVCHQSHPPELESALKSLKKCCSVLFAFQRMCLKDQQFVEESRRWLTDLVGILLRFATIEDHYFLLNHVLRCPKGVSSWAVNFIQVVPPHPEVQNSLGGLVLDHCLTVLATLLSVPASRDSFLHSIKPRYLHSSKESQDNIWIVMDSSGEEEEEDHAETWCNLDEQDLIDLVNQIPFEGIFKHILQLPLDGDASKNYDLSHASSNQLLRLFAFCSQFISIIKIGLKTYKTARYKDLQKRLCRIIRHTVNYVSDHWSNYLLYHLHNPALMDVHDWSHPSVQQETTQGNTFPSNNPMWSRLQVEFDSLFKNAVETIVSTPKCWQFLAVIPYTAVSITRLWSLIYQLHTGTPADINTKNWAALLRHPDTQGRFKDRLVKLAPSEAFYLLTTFANMANSRPDWEMEFIQVVVQNVFEISVVCSKTRELCCRSGRELLAAIAMKHSAITFSTLLKATQENLEHVEVYCLFLYRHLPLHLWHPSNDEIHTLLFWLAYCPAASQESAIARVILSGLNWGYLGNSLALPHSIHMQVALGVVNACVKAEETLGITPTSYKAGILSGSVKSVTAAVCATPPEQLLINWSWQQLSKLRLHKLDQVSELSGSSVLQSSSLLTFVPDVNDELLQPMHTAIIERRPIALYLALLASTWAHSIPQICEEGMTAITELTEAGHYNAVITVLSCITPLLWHSPQTLTTDERFMSCLALLLDADQTYYQKVRNLVMVRGGGGPVLQLLYSMIHSQVLNYSRYGLSNPHLVADFWCQVLIAFPGWDKHQCVLLLIDAICRLVYPLPGSFAMLSQRFGDYANIKTAETTTVPNDSSASSGISAAVFQPLSTLSSSLLSWIRTPQAHSLLPAPSYHLPWFSLIVLRLDTKWEDSTGLWKTLMSNLYKDPTQGIDAALRTAANALKINCPCVNSLTLYRWGQQILSLPVSSPAFLITLQGFLTRHLSRVPPKPQEYACGSVIGLFYEGMINANFLNKIKIKVDEALEYYKNLEEKERKRVRLEETDEVLLQMEEDNFDSLPMLRDYTYKRLLLSNIKAWLNEERLYQTGVYVSTLPTFLNPNRLEYLIEENWEPWEEMFSPHEHEVWSKEMQEKWTEHRHNSSRSPCSSPTASRSSTPDGRPPPSPAKRLVSPVDARALLPSAPPPPEQQGTCVFLSESTGGVIIPDQVLVNIRSIAKRLSEYDMPLTAPSIPQFNDYSPPSSPSIGILRGAGAAKALDQKTLVYELYDYYKLVLSHAEMMVCHWREMCAGDCSIADLLPQLYSNVPCRIVKRQECHPPPPPKGQPPRDCAGQAAIILEFEEKQRHEGVNVRLEQLLAQHKTLLHQSCTVPPLQVCSAAASIDQLIMLLITEYRTARSSVAAGDTQQTTRLKELWQCGWQLFWHVVGLASHENYYYPPAKQLIAATAALLGQEFVSEDEGCQKEIIHKVFRLPEVQGNLVAPHFNPSKLSSDKIIPLYRLLSSYAACNQDLLFMMLSKFDMNRWKLLEKDSVEVLDIIIQGLQVLFGQHEADITLIFGIYRVHWSYLLTAFFNAVYIPSLQRLMELTAGCSESVASLVQIVWFDVMNVAVTPIEESQQAQQSTPRNRTTATFNPSSSPPEMVNNLRQRLQQKVWLTSDLVKQSLQIVSVAFERQRAEQVQYGLFPLYKHNVVPVGAWCCLNTHALIAFTQQPGTPEEFASIWSTVEQTWDQWVYPYFAHNRKNCPQWIKEILGDKKYLQPWSPAETEQANVFVSFYAASLAYFHQNWKGKRSVLSLIIQKYCDNLADRDIKDHILSVVHTHFLSAIPWHHLCPSYQDFSTITKVINMYLPECHSFLGQILIQVPWMKVVKLTVEQHQSDNPETSSPEDESGLCTPRTVSPAKLHSFLLNIIVRIAMEPTVRQCGPLHALLAEAETFHWEFLDLHSYEQVLNWYIMSCDPRVLLPLPARSNVDNLIIHLLHVTANYTPETGTFHKDTDKKRVLLMRALIRLLTNSAARHKSLLNTQMHYFTDAYKDILNHLQATILATVAESDGQMASEPLCSELLAAISHGASSTQLQEVCRDALVQWVQETEHGILLRPLLRSSARKILLLNHRCVILDTLISALFINKHVLRWSEIVQLLHFPATSPAPLIAQACQEGHLLTVYGYMQWRRRCSPPSLEELAMLATTLVSGITTTTPTSAVEKGFVLLLGEVLDMVCVLVNNKKLFTAWEACEQLTLLLSAWEEDKRSGGILGVIGLGPASSVSVKVRVMSRSIKTFLLAQLLTQGKFCSINEESTFNSHDDVDSDIKTADAGNMAKADASLSSLSGLLGLRQNSLYSDVVPSVEEAILFIQDPSNVITDVVKLYSLLISQFYESETMLNHLLQVTNEGRLKWNATIPPKTPEK